MNRKRNTILTVSIILGVVGVGLLLMVVPKYLPGDYDDLAQCLNDKGAVFYGAFWCPHCQNQKAMFGSSARLLNYVECSTPDGKGQRDVCAEKKITSYPTWEFADGSRVSGEVELQELANKTECVLPQ